jgi:antitoxin FitA
LEILAACQGNLLKSEIVQKSGGMFLGLLETIRNPAIDARLTMTSFTIELPEEQVRRLRDLAHKLGTTPEDVLCAGVQEWLTSPATDFAHAASYVLKRNNDRRRG